MNSRVKTFSGAKPSVLSGNVAPGVAEVGSMFGCGARSGTVVDKKRTGLWRELDLRFKMLKELRRLEHFWKMRSPKCAPDCSESSTSQTKKVVKNWHVRSNAE